MFYIQLYSSKTTAKKQQKQQQQQQQQTERQTAMTIERAQSATVADKAKSS